MEYIIIFILILVLTIALAMIREIDIGWLERSKFSPILDNLYNDPTAKEKHQLFQEALKILDKKKKNYNSDYSPSDLITDKLLRHTEKYPQDRFGHERFMDIISRSSILSSEFLFQKLLIHLKVNPTYLSQERFAACVNKAQLLPESLLGSLLDYLDHDPVNPLVQQHFMKCVTHIIFISKEKRQLIYRKALNILENNPSSSIAKQFVLDVGRWHFGKSRKGGRITIYDEQHIQNDILTRSQ